MNRQEAINTLYDIATVLVAELGLTEYEGSGISCGIWDTGAVKLSEQLQKEFGEMKELNWHNGVKNTNTDRWEKRVELGYRFSSPQLCVFGHDASGRQTLAKIELSDYTYIDGELTHTDEYKFSESQFWRMEGFEMQKRLMQMWQDRGGK